MQKSGVRDAQVTIKSSILPGVAIDLAFNSNTEGARKFGEGFRVLERDCHCSEGFLLDLTHLSFTFSKHRIEPSGLAL